MHTQLAISNVEQILTRQMEAWNCGDAGAFTETFAPDATFVTVRGDLVKGHAAIEANHAFIFNGPYKGTRLYEQIESLNFPAANVAVAHVSVEVSGVAAFPPGVTLSGPGKLRTRLLFVCVESEGIWQVSSAQNTIVVPHPVP